MADSILLQRQVYERLLTEVRRRHPRKTFGYLLSPGAPKAPTDFIVLEENIRNSPEWRPGFESYGHYFVEHSDAGFVATPEESWRVQKEVWARGLDEVGVFHSHQRHPANFSRIDWDMHRQRFHDMWHLIVSMRNPDMPQIRAFSVTDQGVHEMAVRVDGMGSGARQQQATRRDDCIARARTLLRAGRAGKPDLGRASEILLAFDDLCRVASVATVHEIVAEGFLRDSEQRYSEHLAPLMRTIPRATFEMGTAWADSGHFYGESPRHTCELPAFQIASVPVTAGLFNLIAPHPRSAQRRELSKPTVNVTWHEAVLFALWMGCRLPTEAEWEYCCGVGSDAQWCCEEEELLSDHAWYSVNARDQLHSVATRTPNSLGLFDMHGNVWEWCEDDYEQDYYQRTPQVSPVNRFAPRGSSKLTPKVVRGGSMNALSEMCRTRYRFHEIAGFRASDLGFRLARGGEPPNTIEGSK